LEAAGPTVNALLSPLRGTFGRALLPAGALPALLFLLGVIVFSGEQQALRNILATAISIVQEHPQAHSDDPPPPNDTSGIKPLRLQPGCVVAWCSSRIKRTKEISTIADALSGQGPTPTRSKTLARQKEVNPSAIDAASGEPKQTQPSTTLEVATWTATLVVLALFFAGIRGWLLELSQTLRFLPSALREWLVGYQFWCYRSYKKDFTELPNKLTALRWAREGFKTINVTLFMPPGAAAGGDVTVKQSRLAREVLSEQNKLVQILLRFLLEFNLIYAVYSLYIDVVIWHSLPAWQWKSSHWLLLEEVEQWRTLLTQESIVRALEAAWRRCYARWAQAAERLENYPAEEWFQPTLLGNRIAAVDDYALPRYEIDTSTLLTRLRGVLPSEAKTALDSAQVIVQTHVNCAVSMMLLALWVCAQPGWSQRTTKHLFFIIAALVGAFVFYRAAVRSVAVVRDTIVRVVDLYRLRVITEAGYAAPATVTEEIEMFRELRRFWTSGAPRSGERKIVVKEPKAPKKEEPEALAGC
jgi:hypothetical protein